MSGPALLSLLTLLAAAGPELTPLEDGRFRLTIVYRDTSVEGHARAQIVLIQAAAKICRGKGKAVSEGLIVNNAQPPRKGLELSEIYSCSLGHP